MLRKRLGEETFGGGFGDGPMEMALVTATDVALPERAAVTDFFQSTLNALVSHIAILRADGTIIAVNAAWDRFATRNGLVPSLAGPGVNYLEVCERASGLCSEESNRVARAIRDIVAGRMTAESLEYPCHSPTERRWFHARITRFEIGSDIRVVVTHDDITARKLAETRLLEVNRLLEAQAMTDGLTGVANRRRLDRALADEWERHARRGRAISCLLIDIDHFKRYNDSLGHQSGDDCLREVAGLVRSAIGRPGDLVARYGGEEFAVVLPETDRAGAIAWAGIVADALRRRALPHPSSPRGAIVTLSIGCATMVPEWGSDPSAIVDRADQALYVAKAEGRDRIRHADDLGLQLPSTLESRERDSARAGAAFVAHGRRSSISPR